jgi:multicomponent Na+:H+ antiporter subunit F
MTFLELTVLAMVIGLLIPIYQTLKANDIWQTMLALSSISTKASVLILVVAVLREDWMIGLVSMIILSVGNAGFMLLAHILRQMVIDD